MKAKIDLVIFDADDTLIDTKKRDYFTFIYLIKKYKNFEDLEYNDFIRKRKEGKKAIELLDAIIPTNLENRSDLLITCFKERNSIFESDRYLLYDQVFEGVEQTLQLLREKKIKIGIASLRKNSKGFRETLKRFHISQLIDICYCSDDLRMAKSDINNLVNIDKYHIHPSNEVRTKIYLYEKIIASLNGEVQRAMVVGDRITDLIGAKIIGAIPIGVQSGYTNRETLRKDGMAYDVIKDVTYLPLALQKLQKTENIEVGFDMLKEK